jgi:hypothetical protein
VAKASVLDSDVSNNVQYTRSVVLQRGSVVTYIYWAITDRLAESLYLHRHDVYPSSKQQYGFS